MQHCYIYIYTYKYKYLNVSLYKVGVLNKYCDIKEKQF